MPIISAVGLFCCDKFEETPNKKVSDLSKLTKPYFSNQCENRIHIRFSTYPKTWLASSRNINGTWIESGLVLQKRVLKLDRNF